MLLGSGFTPSTEVAFGGSSAASVTYLSPEALSVVSPPGSGPVDVVVTTAGGSSATSAADRFFYGAAPTVTGLNVGSGPAGGGTTVTITGTGFTGATAVGFGGVPARDLNVQSDTSLVVTTRAHPPGAVDVVVVGPAGPSAPNAAARFTFFSPVTSTATATPPPGPAGWNNGDVTVQLSATDGGDGSGVASIHYSTGGAETVVAGTSATVTATAEGETTLTYYAVDVAGNAESPHTLTIRIDRTPPDVSCASPDGAWHPADVTLHCTASDALSGLTDANDAGFDLSTSVPDGTETANAATGSRNVCDVAGNCATGGPVAGNRIDRKAPAIAISAPAAQAYVLGQVVSSDYTCSDGGSGVASCSGTVASGGPFDTATVGTKTFAVSAADAVGNTSSASVDYSVGYGIDLLFDASQVKKAGSTIPVRLALTDALGHDVSSSTIDVRAVGVDGGPANDSGGANANGLFRYAGDGYVFNLSTKGLAPGHHVLTISATGDPLVHTIEFSLK